MFVILALRYCTLLLILSPVFFFFLTSLYSLFYQLRYISIYSTICSCSVLLYFTLLSHPLFLSFDFIFALLHSCFALFHCALLCFMLCFPHSLQLSRLLCSCSVSLHLSSLSIWFILPYFALFSFHYIPVCFALLRFFTLPRFDLLHFALLSLFFLVQFPLRF